jgi:CBS domain-containing protein
VVLHDLRQRRAAAASSRRAGRARGHDPARTTCSADCDSERPRSAQVVPVTCRVAPRLRVRNGYTARGGWRAACSIWWQEADMQGEISETKTCLVYCGDGTRPLQFSSPGFSPQPKTHRPSAASVPLHQIMTRQLICARPDLDLKVLIRLMLRNHIGCIPVIDERRRPLGMITKLDLLEQIDATMQSIGDGSPLPEHLEARCADEVMMPLAFCLSEYATVAHAASMMIAEDTHHVIVVGADEQIVGVVSSRDLVAWLLETDSP